MKKKNLFTTLRDLQKALSDAAALGYRDCVSNGVKGSKPTGLVLAEQLLAPGSWAKKQEKSLKSAYLAGFDHAAFANNDNDVSGSAVAKKVKRPVRSA